MEDAIYFITHIDKSTWPMGSWLLEPDKVLWVDKKTGYECLIKRLVDLSHFCSYVGITKDHPLYGCSLFQFRTDEKLKNYFNVHGEITMTYQGKEFIEEPGNNNQIGRKYIDGMTHPTEIFWIGIDFVHKNDIIPKVSQNPNENNGKRVYRDIGYVREETEKLAYQLFKFKDEYDKGKIEFELAHYPEMY